MVTDNRDAGALAAEPDQLGVRPSPWRKPLRRDVKALEQIRLAGAVRSDGQNDARLQL
jgi:hypothetical protein